HPSRVRTKSRPEAGSAMPHGRARPDRMFGFGIATGYQFTFPYYLGNFSAARCSYSPAPDDTTGATRSRGRGQGAAHDTSPGWECPSIGSRLFIPKHYEAHMEIVPQQRALARLRLDLQRHGLYRTAYFLAIKLINKFALFRVLRGMHLNSVNPAYLS